MEDGPKEPDKMTEPVFEISPMAKSTSPTRDLLASSDTVNKVKSTLFDDRDDPTSSTFYDSMRKKWVKVDNFSFSEETNHFLRSGESENREKVATGSAAATTSSLSDESFSLLPSSTLAAAETEFAVAPGEEEELERSLIKELKLNRRPKDPTIASKPLRKLSDELPALPSRSNPTTPRSEEGNREDVEVADEEVKPAETSKKAARPSAIPRFVRNQSPSNSQIVRKANDGVQHQNQGSSQPAKSKSFNSGRGGASSVARKISLKKQRENLDSDRNGFTRSRSFAHPGDPEANDGSKTARAASSGSRGRAPMLASSPRSNSKSEGSLDKIGLKPRIQLHNPHAKKEFRNVKSKVRAYIEEIKNLPSKRRDRELLQSATKDSPLTPGRRAVSLSNLVSDSRDLDLTRSPGGNLAAMRGFISSSNLSESCGKINLSRREAKRLSQSQDSLARFDRSRLAKLLDTFSDNLFDDLDLNDESEVDAGEVTDEADVTFDPEDILFLAIEERREKKEAEMVLSQLQENYDNLQRKYAEAENKIDKLR